MYNHNITQIHNVLELYKLVLFNYANSLDNPHKQMNWR